MKCPSCSENIPNNAKFCGYCGSKVAQVEAEINEDNKSESINQNKPNDNNLELDDNFEENHIEPEIEKIALDKNENQAVPHKQDKAEKDEDSINHLAEEEELETSTNQENDKTLTDKEENDQQKESINDSDGLVLEEEDVSKPESISETEPISKKTDDVELRSEEELAEKPNNQKNEEAITDSQRKDQQKESVYNSAASNPKEKAKESKPETQKEEGSIDQEIKAENEGNNNKATVQDDYGNIETEENKNQKHSINKSVQIKDNGNEDQKDNLLTDDDVHSKEANSTNVESEIEDENKYDKEYLSKTKDASTSEQTIIEETNSANEAEKDIKKEKSIDKSQNTTHSTILQQDQVSSTKESENLPVKNTENETIDKTNLQKSASYEESANIHKETEESEKRNIETNTPHLKTPPESKPLLNKSIIIIALLIIVSVIIVIIVYISGGKQESNPPIQENSNKDKITWKKAEKYNTISSYREYLIQFPRGEYAFDAKELLNQLITNKVNDSIKNIELNAVTQKTVPSSPKASNKKEHQNEPEPTQTNNKVIIKTEAPIPHPQEEPKLTEETVVDDFDSDILTHDEEIFEEEIPSNNAIADEPNEEIANPDEDNMVYKSADQTPTFRGGDQDILKFIAKNTNYPIKASENNIQGTVFINAFVEKDGSLSNIWVLRGIGNGCDEEAIRVVEKMPRWTPAKKDGKEVRFVVTIPVTFKLI